MPPLLELQTSSFHLSKITKIVLLHPPQKKSLQFLLTIPPSFL